MSDNGVKVARSHTLEMHHIAIIDAHAKDSGMNSSEALRDIIDQWARDRARDNGLDLEGIKA